MAGALLMSLRKPLSRTGARSRAGLGRSLSARWQGQVGAALRLDGACRRRHCFDKQEGAELTDRRVSQFAWSRAAPSARDPFHIHFAMPPVGIEPTTFGLKVRCS